MSARFQVHIENLAKSYEERTVLSVESLTLQANTSYALIGSNGSGKSTFLRALAGTSNIDNGIVHASGDMPKGKLSLSYMPQKPYVFGFSVYRNVALAVPPGSCSAQELQDRVHNALEAVGVGNLSRARGNTLSGGEAQRVALARILVRDFDIILLDEPTASMDVEGTLQAERALAEYRKRTGCLMLVATHAPAQAKRIAEEAIMLHAGHVVERGPIEEVLTKPRSSDGQSFFSYWQI